MVRRKDQERAVREAHRKQRESNSYLKDDSNFVSFRNQLAVMGLQLRDIPGDGNCLFRALGDQMDGHHRNHLFHREETVQYMVDNRKDYEPFVEDNMPFERYMANLRRPGTYAGQHCIVAFARLHRLNIVIHQLNAPLWQIEGGSANCSELHLAYHNGEHYSSVRRLGDFEEAPANLRFAGVVARQRLGDDAEFSRRNRKSTRADDWQQRCSASLPSPSFDEDDGRQSSTASNGRDSGFLTDTDCRCILPDESGAVSVRRSTTDIVREIMSNTGCADEALAERALYDHQYNEELAVDYLINYQLIARLGADEVTACSAEADVNDETTARANADTPALSDAASGRTMASTRPASDAAAEQQTKSAAAASSPNRKLPVAKKHLTNRERKDLHRREKADRLAQRRQKADAFGRSQEAVEHELPAEVTANLSCLNL